LHPAGTVAREVDVESVEPLHAPEKLLERGDDAITHKRMNMRKVYSSPGRACSRRVTSA
jgi:hypothetical protein